MTKILHQLNWKEKASFIWKPPCRILCLGCQHHVRLVATARLARNIPPMNMIPDLGRGSLEACTRQYLYLIGLACEQLDLQSMFIFICVLFLPPLSWTACWGCLWNGGARHPCTFCIRSTPSWWKASTSTMSRFASLDLSKVRRVWREMSNVTHSWSIVNGTGGSSVPQPESFQELLPEDMLQVSKPHSGEITRHRQM